MDLELLSAYFRAYRFILLGEMSGNPIGVDKYIGKSLHINNL
jgi:hypothetical protein